VAGHPVWVPGDQRPDGSALPPRSATGGPDPGPSDALPGRAALLGALAGTPGSPDDAPVLVVQIQLEGLDAISESAPPSTVRDVLDELTRRLLAATRPGDAVVELGEGRFGVVCHGPTSDDVARAVAARLGNRVSRPIPLGGRPLQLRSIIGIAAGRTGESSAEALIDAAAGALDAAGVTGQGRFQIAQSNPAGDIAPSGVTPRRAPGGAR
jgi:GGDEF domain-containing protein